MDGAIVIEQVTKTFGSKVAVDDLYLTVAEHGLYGFIGPNGAGKTTTIRMIMSIIFPDSGRLSVLGKKSAVESKDRIGYLPEERGVYRKMKVGAFLAYIARLKGLDGGHALTRLIREWLERVGLEEVLRKKCEELSKGMQQKIQFIACVLHDPELLILDEPFSGLDPVNMRLMRDLFLEQHKQGKTIIFSTHVMVQAEQLCDHIVMIDNGIKVLDASMADIRKQFDPRTILFEPIEGEADTRTIERLDHIESVTGQGGVFEAHLRNEADPGALIQQIAATLPVRRVELRRPTLEDIFITIASDKGNISEHELRARLRDEPALTPIGAPTHE